MIDPFQDKLVETHVSRMKKWGQLSNWWVDSKEVRGGRKREKRRTPIEIGTFETFCDLLKQLWNCNCWHDFMQSIYNAGGLFCTLLMSLHYALFCPLFVNYWSCTMYSVHHCTILLLVRGGALDWVWERQRMCSTYHYSHRQATE